MPLLAGAIRHAERVALAMDARAFGAHPDRTEAYSWWTAWGGARARNVGWRIDYWLASAKLAARVKNPQIHPAQMGSDHCPVSIEIDPES